jgi:hypothetical protein
MEYHIRCESGSFDVPKLSELAGVIENLIATTGDAAYWLHHGEEIIVGFLYNGEHATVFRYSDGAEPFNPDAPEDETTHFRLENGQLDEFYLSKCVDYHSALTAFVQIANTGELTDNIQWST